MVRRTDKGVVGVDTGQGPFPACPPRLWAARAAGQRVRAFPVAALPASAFVAPEQPFQALGGVTSRGPARALPWC